MAKPCRQTPIMDATAMLHQYCSKLGRQKLVGEEARQKSLLKSRQSWENISSLANELCEFSPPKKKLRRTTSGNIPVRKGLDKSELEDLEVNLSTSSLPPSKPQSHVTSTSATGFTLDEKSLSFQYMQAVYQARLRRTEWLGQSRSSLKQVGNRGVVHKELFVDVIRAKSEYGTTIARVSLNAEKTIDQDIKQSFTQIIKPLTLMFKAQDIHFSSHATLKIVEPWTTFETAGAFYLVDPFWIEVDKELNEKFQIPEVIFTWNCACRQSISTGTPISPSKCKSESKHDDYEIPKYKY